MTAEAVIPSAPGTVQNYAVRTPPCPAGDYTAASVGGYVVEPTEYPGTNVDLVGTRLDPATNAGVVYWDHTAVGDVSVVVWTNCQRA
ncbi:hypothetical protein [Streptomyces sp. UH6]|uniref:hypothetical protein n=1 Tax=Streptomyces sp. UH6 TaxID=2748379 RepID=UPI001C553DC0|nr:hypothetical protein [Streptomyces sp. UH6]